MDPRHRSGKKADVAGEVRQSRYLSIVRAGEVLSDRIAAIHIQFMASQDIEGAQKQ